MFNKQLLMISMVAALSACGGSSSDSPEEIEIVATVPDLNEMSMPLGALTQQSTTTFERHLKNGVYLRNQNDLKINFSGVPESTSSDSSSSSFSSTITQEQGVDEADRIKYDGQYLFIATHENSISIMEEGNEKAQTAIRIMQRNDSGTMNEVSQITVNEEATHINGIYLNNDVLAVLSDIYSYNIAATSFLEGFFPTEQNFNLSLVSVVNPQVPEQTRSLTVDGSIIDSRRVDDTLYIVSSYSASMDDINYASTTEEELANYNTIMQADINELLPKYIDENGEEHNLVNAENCYLPEQSTELDGFDGIVTLTAINLQAPSEVKSVCVNAQVQGLYASSQSVYLYGTDYQYQEGTTSETSVIHKFSMQEQTVTYQASGTLNGRFNWNLSNLRFSEQGNYLRVVTTTGNGGDGFEHQLNVLMEDAGELSVVSQLPNDINPQVIGKVSEDGKVYEDIKSVRFYQDLAYIVTFENTDPLYVIDLKDNVTPSISGELEIPGYSAYLHPLSDDLLLGIGQNVDATRLTVNNDMTDSSVVNSVDDSPVVEGAKVSLFDVSDINNPKELHSIVYAETYTPVEYNYHALTMLTMSDGSMRFAMPTERWITETLVDEKEQKYDVWRPENNLVLFEVTNKTQSASLVEIGQISAEDPQNELPESQYYGGWDDRSIFHGDDIYYIHGHHIWQSLWSNPKAVTGPF